MLLLCVQTTARGQNNPTFEASTNTKNISAGSRFEIIFRLRNAEGDHFRPPRLVDLRVTGGPSQERSMGFVNGKTYHEQVWRYEVEALKPGEVTIEPATIVVNGKTLSTQPLRIQVGAAKSPPANLSANGDEKVFLTAEIFPKTLYVGQQAGWQVKVYTLVGLDGADAVEWPDFKGFFAKEKRRFDTGVDYVTLKGKKYATKILYEESLFPQEAGELTVAPARVRIGIEQPGSIGAFLGSTPVQLETNPVTVKVLPLPQPVPAHFSGGVGHYEWSLVADKDTLSTDDALTLKVSLKGNGDARRFSAPVFNIPAGLEAFDPKTLNEEEYDNGQELLHEQTLEYAIIPKAPGHYTMLPEMVYFDVDSNRYITLRPSAPINLRIGQGKNYQAEDPDTAAQEPENASQGFKALRNLVAQPLFWVGLGLLLGFWVWWRQRKTDTPPSPAPSVPSAPPAQEVPAPAPRPIIRQDYLIEAGKLTGAVPQRLFYSALLKGLQQYMETVLELTPAQLNVPEIERALISRQVDSDIVQGLVQLWQRSEAAVYGGMQFPETPDLSLETARGLLARLPKPNTRTNHT